MKFLSSLAALLLLSLSTTVSAIYPDDLWEHSMQLDEKNFDTIVKDEIEMGRTMFVRFIAGPK